QGLSHTSRPIHRLLNIWMYAGQPVGRTCAALEDVFLYKVLDPGAQEGYYSTKDSVLRMKEWPENPMPKTTKRAATRRAARIAKAHATELPRLEVKEPLHNAPGYKRPARGLARYPWAIFLT